MYIVYFDHIHSQLYQDTPMCPLPASPHCLLFCSVCNPFLIDLGAGFEVWVGGWSPTAGMSVKSWLVLSSVQAPALAASSPLPVARGRLLLSFYPSLPSSRVLSDFRLLLLWAETVPVAGSVVKRCFLQSAYCLLQRWFKSDSGPLYCSSLLWVILPNSTKICNRSSR